MAPAGTGGGGGVDPSSFTTVLWSSLAGRTGVTFAVDAVGADLAGNVVVAGSVDAAYDFGPDAVGTGAFVLLLDPSGATSWAVSFPTLVAPGGTGAPLRGRVETAVLPGGDVLFAGAAFDPTSIGTYTFTPPAAGALVFGRLDSAGAPLWARTVANTDPAAFLTPAALAVTGSGDLLVAGTGSGDFGCGATTGPTFAAALAGADGSCRWSRGFTTRSLSDVEARDSGEVAIAGVCAPSTAFFDPGGGTTCTKGLYVAVLAGAGGATVWARTTSGAGSVPTVNDVAVAPDGSVTVIGDALGVVDFGGGAVSFGSAAASFAATFGPTGIPLGVLRPIEAPYAADPDAVSFARCAYDRSGQLWLAGAYVGAPTLGGIRFSACRASASCLAAAYLAAIDASGRTRSFLPLRAEPDAAAGAFVDDFALFATTDTVAHALRFTGVAPVGGATWTSAGGDLGTLRIVP